MFELSIAMTRKTCMSSTPSSKMIVPAITRAGPTPLGARQIAVDLRSARAAATAAA